MQKPDKLTILSVLLALFLFWGCAKIVSPTGGPKDSQAPLVLESSPSDGSTNFKENKLVLEFDEFIQLGNSSEILISPFMAEPPEVKQKGKKVILKFPNDLRPNTTYSVDFGKAIKDLNEGNVTKDLRMSFSTGSQLDTLEIGGTVLNAETLEPVSGVVVGLYDSLEMAAFENSPPFYVARTDEGGNWKIQNLADGQYRMVALEDQDFNYFYSQPSEPIAFMSNPISIPDSIDQYQLLLFALLDTLILVEQKKTISLGKDLLIMKGPVDDKELSLEFLNDSLNISSSVIEQNKKNEYQIFYQLKANHGKQKAALLLDGIPIDTLRFSTDFKKDSLKPNTFKLTSTIKGAMLLEKEDTAVVEFDYPLLDSTAFDISFWIDSLWTEPIPTVRVEDNQLQIIYPWEEAKSHQIQIIPTHLMDMFERPIQDTISATIKLRTEDDYGQLVLYFPDWNPETNFRFELNSKSGLPMVKGIVDNDTMRLEGVQPGTGRIKVIEDLNGNGQWDPGNYAERLQPEAVYSPSSDISVRAGWDTEAVIKFQ